jgi:hypothetical protein
MSRVSGSAGLELSQWRMRSPWRVPRWSAERRARPAGRAAVLRRARPMEGAPTGAPPPFALVSLSCPFVSRTRCSAQKRVYVRERAIGCPQIGIVPDLNVTRSRFSSAPCHAALRPGRATVAWQNSGAKARRENGAHFFSQPDHLGASWSPSRIAGKYA